MKKFIFTDLDRTLFPNGEQSIDANSMSNFKNLLDENNVGIVFVTGRYKELVFEGIKEFNPPSPMHCICDVGTSIYDKDFNRLSEWDEVLRSKWKDHNRFFVKELLEEFSFLREQESVKLNDFKQSYYLKAEDKNKVELIKNKLEEEGVPCEVIYSYDVNEKIGLLDIQPRGVTKKGAIDFLIKKLSIRKENVLYSGDSGNDVHALLGGYKGVLVGNASKELKEELKGKVFVSNKCFVEGIIDGAYNYSFFSK